MVMGVEKKDLLLYAVTDRSWLGGRALAEVTDYWDFTLSSVSVGSLFILRK